MTLLRAALYVDGFNLYHSIDDFGDDTMKWLSLWALGERIIPKQQEQLVLCGYFSAYATHLIRSSPLVVQRHRTYVAALVATGVTVKMGIFKNKDVRCNNCGARWVRHEEKETDVNIAVDIVAAAYRNAYDVVYVLSADTDLAPAMREVQRVVDVNGVRTKRVVAVFPPIAPGHKRRVSELQQSSDQHISLNDNHIRFCRLPNTVIAGNGSHVVCPQKYQ